MKNVFCARTYHFLICSFTALTLIFLGVGCKKVDNSVVVDQKRLVQTNAKEIDPLVKMYQNYFTSEILENESKMLVLSYKEPAQNSEIRRNAHMGKLNPLLQWDKAATFQISGIRYVTIPLNEDIKPFKNKRFEFYRNFVFSKNNDGSPTLMVIEVLSKKDQTLGSDLQNLIKASIENSTSSNIQSTGDLNAYVIVYNQNYVRQKSYDLTKGKWKNKRISLNSEYDINNDISRASIKSNLRK